MDASTALAVAPPMLTAPSHISGPVDKKQLRAIARERFGIRRFRPGQLELMEAVLAGRNALGILPTGAGKSLTYQLPSLALEGAVVVVSPLIALMKDQQDKLDELDIPTAHLNSTLRPAAQREVYAQLRAGEYDIVYVTPERLQQADCQAALRARGVALLVVDEAHCVSQWGHDFRPAYLEIRSARELLGAPPLLALTATATAEMIADILKQLGVEGAEVVHTGVERENLTLRVVRTPRVDTKLTFLTEFLAQEDGVGIVYTTTIRSAEELHRALSQNGTAAGLYHGKLAARERAETQELFMADQLRVMVATSAFGLGIDKPNLRFVVHYNFPDSLESYYQEAGRAGRDGQDAQCILLYRLEDRRLHSFFIAGRYPERAETRKVLSAVRGSGVSPLSEITRAADVSEKRVKIVLAQLEGAGLVTRHARGVESVRSPRDDAELETLLSAYERRRQSDRERLDAVMHYAQSTRCRAEQLVAYFTGDSPGPCGRCDNCAGAQGTAQPSARAPSLDLDRLIASACGNVEPAQVLGTAPAHLGE